MKQRVEREKGQRNTAGEGVLGPYLSRTRRHKILSRREERLLSLRIQEGDEAAWEELVRHNLRLVVSIARGYTGRGLEFADLLPIWRRGCCLCGYKKETRRPGRSW